ncbi:hypothetical protein C2W62_19100 [Candidatus Entotheonella serta]|nr:hypothetical protein C2W62_19100 [Candidatus Entotheonella serta]
MDGDFCLELTLFRFPFIRVAPFSVATFFFGLFWGWLYARHGTLIGPIISHALLGFWALYILGIMDML